MWYRDADVLKKLVPRRDGKQLNRGLLTIRKYVLQLIVSAKMDVLIEKKTP
jgi:hypothetical protein